MKRISEKLHLDKHTPIEPDNSIVNFICVIWGFLPLDKMHDNDTSHKQCIDIINEWIGKYNITKISKAYYTGSNSSQGYFNALKDHVEKYLGDKEADKFTYNWDSIDDLDVWNRGTKKKINGTNIYIVYTNKEIAVVSDEENYEEARVISI